jgi:hypothetical protein
MITEKATRHEDLPHSFEDHSANALCGLCGRAETAALHQAPTARQMASEHRTAPLRRELGS